MSARDDYQIHKVTAVGKELGAMWRAMCDEIDRLHAENAQLRRELRRPGERVLGSPAPARSARRSTG